MMSQKVSQAWAHGILAPVKAEAGGSQVQGEPEQFRETLCQN